MRIRQPPPPSHYMTLQNAFHAIWVHVSAVVLQPYGQVLILPSVLALKSRSLVEKSWSNALPESGFRLWVLYTNTAQGFA